MHAILNAGEVTESIWLDALYKSTRNDGKAAAKKSQQTRLHNQWNLLYTCAYSSGVIAPSLCACSFDFRSYVRLQYSGHIKARIPGQKDHIEVFWICIAGSLDEMSSLIKATAWCN